MPPEAATEDQFLTFKAANLESDFADGSVHAGIELAGLYLFSPVFTGQYKQRAACILTCLLSHDREACRLMAYCYLYGIGVHRDVESSKELLRLGPAFFIMRNKHVR